MAGGKDETVAETQPRPADVPAHRPGQEQGQEHVDLGPRAAGVAALPVVELQVDQLVDEILQDLVMSEFALGPVEEPLDLGYGPRAGSGIRRRLVRARPRVRLTPGRPHETAAPWRASTIGSTTARVRRTASAMFSRELA